MPGWTHHLIPVEREMMCAYCGQLGVSTQDLCEEANRQAPTPEQRIEDKFVRWMRMVDLAVRQQVGLSVHDLPDIAFRDLFDDGVSPKRAARQAIAEELF